MVTILESRLDAVATDARFLLDQDGSSDRLSDYDALMGVLSGFHARNADHRRAAEAAFPARAGYDALSLDSSEEDDAYEVGRLAAIREMAAALVRAEATDRVARLREVATVVEG